VHVCGLRDQVWRSRFGGMTKAPSSMDGAFVRGWWNGWTTPRRSPPRVRSDRWSSGSGGVGLWSDPLPVSVHQIGKTRSTVSEVVTVDEGDCDLGGAEPPARQLPGRRPGPGGGGYPRGSRMAAALTLVSIGEQARWLLEWVELRRRSLSRAHRHGMMKLMSQPLSSQARGQERPCSEDDHGDC